MQAHDVANASEATSESRARQILVVDDDDDVRDTAADILEQLGYDVKTASSGLEALDSLQRYPTVELMLTDVRMPGMSGFELYELAAARHRALKIIIMSGYFTPRPVKCRFLRKPFLTTDLDAAIRAELDIKPGDDGPDIPPAP